MQAVMNKDSKCNLSAVLYKTNDLRMEQQPIMEPKENEVLIQMCCVGICGSDVHYLTHGRIADFILKDPMIIGHEASGIVYQVGEKVKHLKPGDRVAIEPGVPCRMCTFCKQGRYNLCSQIYFCATPPDHGNLSRFYVHAADFCHKLPDHVTMEEGALLEPLSVGVHACTRAGITIGSKVLITGAGPIGLVSLITAKAMGAGKVLITDIQEHRLNVAKNCGADYTLLIKRGETEGEIAKKIHAIMGDAPDKTIDCSGIESTISLGIEATKSGGVIVIVGCGPNYVRIPLIKALSREVDIRGVFRYANSYPIALAMVASGKVNIKQLITHNYVLEDTLSAFETAKTGAGNAIKVMIHCKEGITPEHFVLNQG